MNDELERLAGALEREYRAIAAHLPADVPPEALSARVSAALRVEASRWHAARLRRWNALGAALAASVALLLMLRVGTIPPAGDTPRTPSAALDAWVDALAISSEQVALRISGDADTSDSVDASGPESGAGGILETLDESLDAIDILVGV